MMIGQWSELVEVEHDLIHELVHHSIGIQKLITATVKKARFVLHHGAHLLVLLCEW
jgi:hypothetical protein